MRKIKYSLQIILFLLIVCCEHNEAHNICAANVQIGLVSITENSAVLKWVETQGYSSIVEYGPEGFRLGDGTQIETQEEMILLEGLIPSTQYDFYLKSICPDEVEGEFITNPYNFSTNDCNGFDEQDVVLLGWKFEGFEIAVYPEERTSNEWEYAIIPMGTELKPTDINQVKGKYQFNVESNELEQDGTYDFYARRICENAETNWVIKSFSTDAFNCDIAYNVTNNDGYNFSVDFIDLPVDVEIVKQGNGVGSGMLVAKSVGNFSFNKTNLHNEYPEYFEPDTLYDVLVRSQCGSSYSEPLVIYEHKTPKANTAYLVDVSVTEDSIMLRWPIDFGFNQLYCNPYDVVVYQIEYGPVGFENNIGVLLETEGVPDEYPYYKHILDKSNFDQGETYEFSIRSVVNNGYPGEWNASACHIQDGSRLQVVVE
ncbi:hypothetical protein K1F50_07490 [Muricauda oceani]|uniref:Fibronectin type III domain-containing protein n=1 Tax=Flagellimonas oceani TaxID=2698672 RepID=A0A6G7J6G2_9FLAO|nr:hypothetical protein [Allomuricauda oceani]MBW8242640.1 hypothetical protein [Allomuricauda oceani]QII46396.1 hypothetical protein GVT53_17475 [Allomuricauda oceani]